MQDTAAAAAQPIAQAAAQPDTGGATQPAATAEQLAELASQVQDLSLLANNLWLLIAAAMVFIMHLGFASLESGLTRAKNTVNILFKNVGVVGLGLLSYWVVGYSLMYPGTFLPDELVAGKLFAFGGFLAAPPEGYESHAYAGNNYTFWTDFIFQGMFAATAATIVSGAVAERIKLESFLIFSLVYVAAIYPIVGMWHWGGGYLAEKGFHDFAGSTIVHSVGGWGALAGVIVLGPRVGKYVRRHDGKIENRALMGHSMPLAAIGVFLLWFGWFGFNGGSVLSANPEAVSIVFVTTSIAASAGIFGAMAASWTVQRKPDLTMILNGILAGLVGVTAGADTVSVPESALIGLVAGVIVVLAVVGLDRLRLDDPVGAVSVHLVCGIWGTLAAGIFGEGKSIAAQLLGIGMTAALCFPAALALFAIMRYTIGIRVGRKEELGGLDLGEHGMEAYAGFQFFTNQ